MELEGHLAEVVAGLRQGLEAAAASCTEAGVACTWVAEAVGKRSLLPCCRGRLQEEPQRLEVPFQEEVQPID